MLTPRKQSTALAPRAPQAPGRKPQDNSCAEVSAGRKIPCIITLATTSGGMPFAIETASSLREVERRLRDPINNGRRDLHITLIVIDPRHPKYGVPQTIWSPNHFDPAPPHDTGLELTPAGLAALERACREAHAAYAPARHAPSTSNVEVIA